MILGVLHVGQKRKPSTEWHSACIIIPVNRQTYSDGTLRLIDKRLGEKKVALRQCYGYLLLAITCCYGPVLITTVLEF